MLELGPEREEENKEEEEAVVQAEEDSTTNQPMDESDDYITEERRKKSSKRNNKSKQPESYEGNKRFACPICKKKLSLKQHLDRHNLIHSGGKAISVFNM